MSKKISLILAIVLALIGVVVVSVFGKLPEYLQPKVLMQQLYFEDENITINSKGDKIYYMDIGPNNLSIDLYSMVQYKPYDTTNIDMKFVLSDTTIAKVSKTGFLTFMEDAVKTFDGILTVTVNSVDGSALSDKLMIMRPSNDTGEDTFDDFIFFE